MDRQHNTNLPQLAVDVISPSTNENQYPEVGTHRPPMFVLSFTGITYRVCQTEKPVFSPLYRSDKGDSTATIRPRLRTLLDSISGEAREGEIFAIMGASGSGKSTLIDALANRIAKESLQGSITLNGDILESRLLKVLSAHVMQDDLLYPMLTVKETLMYAAEFRLPRSVPKEQKRKRVEELIKQLSLQAATNTIIGDEGHRGVSGGERRRVSIGIDIVHNPILLFLDEPTSGLDSTSAFLVVKVLKDIARRGSIVILSIHQPSSRILNLLERVLFLSRGQTVFYGPPSGLSMYFSEFGNPIPDKENPAEFALDLIREKEATANGAKELVQFTKSWKRRHGDLFFSDQEGIKHIPLHQAIAASFASGRLVSSTNNLANVSVASVGKFKSPFWIEMGILSKRAFTNNIRMPELLLVRFASVLITGIILATIFWRLDDTPKGVQERLGFYSIGMATMFYSCADALPVFMQERYIYMRETAHNAYRKSSFVLSNAIVGLPALILLSFGFALTTFFAVGLDGGMSGFLFYVATILASFWAGSGLVTFMSGIVNNIILAYVLAMSVLTNFFIFDGFFVDRDRIPDYWIWFHYISLLKYPYQAVVQNEFSDPKKCFVRGTQMFERTPLEVFPEPIKVDVLASISSSLGLNLTNVTCITNGADILRQYSLRDLNKWNCLWVTIAWGFFFRILFYVMLLLGSKNKRT